MKILDKIVADGTPPESPFVMWLKVKEFDELSLLANINGEWITLNASNSALINRLNSIEAVIPDAANEYNQLADKDYVTAQITSIQRIGFEVVPSLPPASANTMLKIYLVPSTDPKFQNAKDEYVTIQNINEGGYYYTWEKIGSTEMTMESITHQEIDALFV